MSLMETVDSQEMFMIRSRLDSVRSQPSYKVFVIPGNPGLCGYYKEFVSHVFESLSSEGFADLTVAAISHRGHWRKRERTWYSYEEQIEHQITQVLRLSSPEDRVVLIGHSIGCCISLRAMDSPQLKSRVEQSLLLFPTIERMAVSPQGRKTGWLCGWLFQYLAFVLTLLLSFFPEWLRRRLIAGYMRRSKRQASRLHSCIIDTTLDLVTPAALPQVLHMANHEMAEVKDLDVDLVRRCLPRTVFYYGRGDSWCPEQFFWDMCKRFPEAKGSRLKLFEANFPHAFVLGFGIPVADACLDLIRPLWKSAKD